MILTVILIVLVILYAAARLYVRSYIRRTEAAFPPQGRMIQVDGLPMHYLEAGDGDTVVFIHGSFGSVNDFSLSLFPHLKNTFRAVAFDRPGHGYSARPRGISMTLEDHAASLHSFFKTLKISRPVVVGHSLGAAIALHYALAYPGSARGLVLLSPYVKPWEGPTNPIHTAAGVPIAGFFYLNCLVPLLGVLMKDGIARKVFSPDEPPADYAAVSSALAMRPSHFGANAEDIRNFRSVLRPNWERYREIRIPVTIVTGDKDEIAPLERHSRYLAQEISGAELRILPGTGHQPSFIHPDEILNAVHDMLEKSRETVS